MAQIGQCPLNAIIAPTRILSGHLNNKLSDELLEREVFYTLHEAKVLTHISQMTPHFYAAPGVFAL